MIKSRELKRWFQHERHMMTINMASADRKNWWKNRLTDGDKKLGVANWRQQAKDRIL